MARVAVVGCVAVALVVALYRLPAAFRGLNNRAAHNAQQTARERELEVARQAGISTAFVLAAQQLLPSRATYLLETGPRLRPPSPDTFSALPGYLQNLLLPRLSGQPNPEWLLCYGCDPSGHRISLVAWKRGPLLIARLMR